LVLYVHLNPVRAGAVRKLEEHVLCGHREIVKRTGRPLIDIDDALLAFGSTARAARRNYLSGIRVGCEEAENEPPKAERGLFTGQDRDLEPKEGQNLIDVLGRSTGIERPMLTAKDYLAEACTIVGVSAERISSRVRDRDTAYARRLLVTLAVERWRMPGVNHLCALTTIRNVHRKKRRIVVEGGWLWETRRGFSKACGKVAEGQLSIGRQAPDRGEGSPRGEGGVFHRQPPGYHDFLSSVDLAVAV
jgi:hypothetical protein